MSNLRWGFEEWKPSLHVQGMHSHWTITAPVAGKEARQVQRTSLQQFRRGRAASGAGNVQKACRHLAHINLHMTFV